MADKKDLEALFLEMHPGFFEREYIRSIPEGLVCEEMILPLDTFDPGAYRKSFEDSVSFGFFHGSQDDLHAAVEKVVPAWVKLYDGKSRVYCGFIDGRIASFCIVEDMGTHTLGGRTVRIGGPGCVGTLPEYRKRGIGLTMVRDATRILKEEGFDFSYIHYTGVAPWYQKLGYRTVLKWNRNGIL
ncbi:MAG: GNAT family N-acetyltransferase [Clostridia bacterium]|nr:GNAT family N-acetyltransferase [Clostridia bacterium]